VVGVFEAGGGALESEIWAPRTVLRDAHNRNFSSSVVLKLKDPKLAGEAIRYVEGPTVQLIAKSEIDYYKELSKTTLEIVVLTMILVAIMMVGAMFAVANTMYSAVDGRRREIAMLRTIGFSRGAILLAFLVESVLICGIACGVGLAASLLIHGSKSDYFSDSTFTVLAYELEVTPRVLLVALCISILVGVGGALAPAIKASRTRIIEALRKA
jgi:ABC-type lipoprotein release transport system permease subunit